MATREAWTSAEEKGTEEQIIRTIVQKGAAILERKADEVVLPAERALATTIVSDLIDTASGELTQHVFGKGIGLSAPQINYGKRIFVVKLPDRDFQVFIDPVITQYSEGTDLQSEFFYLQRENGALS